MNVDASTVWTALASSAFVSAGVQLIAKYYLDARLEREKARAGGDVQREIETLRAALQERSNSLAAEQTRVNDRLHTMFSTLQTERADVIKDLYARIVAVESLLNAIAVEKAVTDDSARRYTESVEAFIGYFMPNRIWLPVEVSDQVSELRSLFFSLQKTIASTERNIPISNEFRQGLIVVKGAAARTLEDVSASFRALLGAEI